MKTTRLSLAIMLPLCLGMGSGPAVAAELPVVARELVKLRVPDKVQSVIWTRRSSTCTLQVVLQMPTEFQIAAKSTVQRGVSPSGTPIRVPALPRVQAWALRSDGTAISRTSGTAAFPAAIIANDGVPLEVSYSYPLTAAQEAVAVAIMIDDTWLIEQLRPFSGGGR